MGLLRVGAGSWILAACLILIVLPAPVAAFGAGNIPSIAQVEGLNFRHGDIEDMLKTIAFIKGHKWTSMMVKRVYFGNWLRDYSQAVDVGSLKGVSAPTIRILVWVLSFLSFGYATGEFEVTEERLGVYRPEEHIDNPKDYADNLDARQYDKRLRGPVQKIELEVDTNTGMKNYISNESGGWATSAGYVKFSMSRSIHFGRVYTSGSGHSAGKEEDLCEALRCLGQGLHCLEDFGAHTNYVELALRELGYREVFPHVGVAAEINVRGKRIYPLVTGTFGAVDFLHSVLGEATDHFTQTEIDEMNVALITAEKGQAASSSGERSLFGSGGGGGPDFISLLTQIPGLGGGLAADARNLQQRSAAQDYENSTRANVNTNFSGPPGSIGGPPGPGVPGMSENFDPVKTAKQIYPILEFRDKVVKAISTTIAKIPGLEAIVEKIGETLTIFVLSLLAPFVRPIIDAVSASLKKGSSEVVEASANSQFEPWNDAYSTNPTHSMLSKDHFSNKLNGVAGRVATTILQYVTPRILYAWQNPGVSVDEVMADILQVFHHPALRNEHCEVHRNMFNTVRKWVEEQPDAHSLNSILSSASVKAGHNHAGGGAAGTKGMHDHSHGSLGGHGKTSGSLWGEIQTRDMTSLSGGDFNPAFASSDARPVTPAYPPSNDNFGYHNTHPGTSGSYGGDRPSSSGGYLGPPQDSYYQSGPPVNQYQQENYGGGYQQQPPYGGPPPNQYGGPPHDQYGGPPPGHYGGPPPGQYGGPSPDQYGGGAPPYPAEQTYGGYNSYQQGGPPQGPPGGWNQGPPQQPPYGQQYPPQHQQPPYSGGGGGGGFPGAGYHGGY